MADELESLLWDKMLSSDEDSSKKIFFEAYRDFLRRYWLLID